MKTNKFLLKLDLQKHADDEVIQGGYVPDNEPVGENPLLTDDPAEQTTEEFQDMGENLEGQNENLEQQTEEQPNMFDFGGRQVNPNDPESLKGLHEDWTQTQRYIQQMQTERQQLQQQMYQMAQAQQQLFQQQQPQQPQEEPFDSEAFLEKFYANPNEAIGSITQKAVEQAIGQIRQEYEPIVKERQYQEQIHSVASKYQDFQKYVPQISQMVAQMGEDGANQVGLENLYFRAKALSQPDPNQFLNDPQFITQHVMNNEQIRNQLYNEFMRTKQQTQPKAPVMGNQYGGQASFANQSTPKSLEEAGKLARQYFNQN